MSDTQAFGGPYLSHISSHGCFGNIDSLSLQIFSQPGAAIAPLGIEVCIFNFPTKLHLLLFSFINRVLNPAAITAARYTQYSAHHLDRPFFGMIFYEFKINDRSWR